MGRDLAATALGAAGADSVVSLLFRFFAATFGFRTGSGFSTFTGGGGGEGEGGADSGETEVMSTDGDRTRPSDEGELGATESSGGGGKTKWKVRDAI